MGKSIFQCAALCLLGSAILSAQGTGYVVPQFAIGGGLEALLFVANKTADTIDVDVFLRQGNADPWDGLWKLDGVSQAGSESTFPLGPKQIRKIVLSANGPARSGYLNVVSRGGAWARLSVSFFYNLVSEGALIDSIGVPPTSVRTTAVISSRDEFTYKYTAAIELGPGINTGVAITHGLRLPSASEGTIRLTLYDGGGDAIRTKTLNNDGHTALFINEIWTDLPPDFVGMLQVEPTNEDTDFYMTVLRQEQTVSGFQLTSIPPDNINELIAGGACGLLLRTEIW